MIGLILGPPSAEIIKGTVLECPAIRTLPLCDLIAAMLAFMCSFKPDLVSITLILSSLALLIGANVSCVRL